MQIYFLFKNDFDILHVKIDKMYEADWRELIAIHSELKNLVQRLKKFEGGSEDPDIAAYSCEILAHYNEKEDSLQLVMASHPSLYRDFDDQGKLRKGHQPHPDMNFRPSEGL